MEYTKKLVLRYNLQNKRVYFDVDTLVKNINQTIKQRSFPIKDSKYELFICLDRPSKLDFLTLNITLYDEDGEDYPIETAIALFESKTEFKNWITSTVNKFVELLNQASVTAAYFEHFNGLYSIENNKLYAAVYDFSTNTVLTIPEAKTIQIQFDEPDVNKLLDQIL